MFGGIIPDTLGQIIADRGIVQDNCVLVLNVFIGLPCNPAFPVAVFKHIPGVKGHHELSAHFYRAAVNPLCKALVLQLLYITANGHL